MARNKRSGHRGGGNKRVRRKLSRPRIEQNYRDTPYGRIPLVERTLDTGYGKTVTYYQLDLNYKPKLPKNAVAGDPTRQNFCPLCHTPYYYFLDKERSCVQCGGSFVFSAKEQKYWYESLKFYLDSVAIRCASCRRQRRSEKALAAQISAAQAKLNDDPGDLHALLEDAESRVRYYQKTGSGNLNRAISSARKALRIWPKAIEGYFWEGLAQMLAGRSAKGQTLLRAFVEQGGCAGKQRRPLCLEAKEFLAQVERGG